MIHMPREDKQKAGDKAEQGNHNQHHVGLSHQLRQSELVLPSRGLLRRQNLKGRQTGRPACGISD
jgi:hypothetical protein